MLKIVNFICFLAALNIGYATCLLYSLFLSSL